MPRTCGPHRLREDSTPLSLFGSFAGEYPLDDSKRLCVHTLESAMQAFTPGTETILGIFDLKGFSSKNADLGFVRFLVSESPTH